jgi:hypothetical protein
MYNHWFIPSWAPIRLGLTALHAADVSRLVLQQRVPHDATLEFPATIKLPYVKLEMCSCLDSEDVLGRRLSNVRAQSDQGAVNEVAFKC